MLQSRISLSSNSTNTNITYFQSEKKVTDKRQRSNKCSTGIQINIRLLNLSTKQDDTALGKFKANMYGFLEIISTLQTQSLFYSKNNLIITVIDYHFSTSSY